MKVAQERELYSLVLEAVNSLSPKNRTTVLLFYFEQLTIYEISALLDSSVSAVKGRLYKARKQLKDKLLPLYFEDSSIVSTNQNTTMIKVTVADVVSSPSVAPQSSVVILWDEKNRQFLPIFVGMDSGATIAHILIKTSMTRPMTLQFMSNMLKAADVNLKSIRIESLEENTYYAVATLGCRGQVKEVDARPSDAIALALLENKPIYVNESVMEEAAIEPPPDVENAPVGRGLSSFQNEYERKKQERKQKLQEDQEKFQQISREENIKLINDLTIEFLFDTD